MPMMPSRCWSASFRWREAIREALLTEHAIAASQGVYNFTEKDRYGLDDRSRILLTVKNGKYVLVK